MKCISCEKVIKKIFTQTYKGKSYEICHCSRCDLQFYKDIKKTDQEYYEELYQTWNVEGINIRGLIWGNHMFFKKMIKYLTPEKSIILDIGSADGLFVNEAVKHGYKAHGIDINPQLVKAAKKFYNIKTIYYGEVKDIKKYVKEKFSAITFFDVLEHLEDPAKYVRDLKKYIGKNGYVFVSIPNRNCKPRLLPLDGDLPPHHLTWWSEKSLTYLFENAGYIVKEYYTEGVNPKDMAVWFDQLLTNMIPAFKNIKANIQEASSGKNTINRKKAYQLKDLELKVLTIIFYIPAAILTVLGGTGTAQCIIVKRSTDA